VQGGPLLREDSGAYDSAASALPPVPGRQELSMYKGHRASSSRGGSVWDRSGKSWERSCVGHAGRSGSHHLDMLDSHLQAGHVFRVPGDELRSDEQFLQRLHRVIARGRSPLNSPVPHAQQFSPQTRSQSEYRILTRKLKQQRCGAIIAYEVDCQFNSGITPGT
jgi:hypothetical protein